MYSPTSKLRGCAAILIPSLLSGIATDVSAQTGDTIYTWTGLTTSALWSTPNNWNTHSAPRSSSDTALQFAQSNNTAVDNDLDNFQLNAIIFDVSASMFTVSGNKLNFVANSQGELPVLMDSSNKRQTIQNDLQLSDTLLVNFAGRGDIVLTGAISGNGGLALVGPGSLQLGVFGINAANNIANTFTGDTNIDMGQILLDKSLALQNSTVDINIDNGLNLNRQSSVTLGGLAGNGALDLGNTALTIGNNNNSSTFSGIISASLSGDSLSKIGTGDLTLSGANTFTGDTNINNGRIWLGNSLALQNSTVDINIDNGLNLNRQSSVTLGGLAGNGALNLGSTALTIGINGSSTSFSGQILGAGSLTKTGAGNLTLSNSTNAYAGGTTIAGGTLTLGATGAVPAGFNFAVTGTSAAAVFDLAGHNQTINNLTFGDGTANSVNHLTVRDSSGGGSLLLNGNIAFDGGLNSGQPVTPGATIAAALTLSSGQHNLTYTGGYVPEGRYSTDPYHLVLAGQISGAGELDISNGLSVALGHSGNTYTGPTNLVWGNLFLAAPNALSSQTSVTVGGISYLVLDPSAAQTGVTPGSYNQSIGSLSGSGGVDLGSATLTVGADNTDTTFSGSLYDHGLGGSLVKTGTGIFTLTGNDAFAGGVTINAGTLNIASDSNLGTGGLSFGGGTLQLAAVLTDNHAVTLNAGGAIDTNGYNGTFCGVITGPGGLVKAGVGTLTLAGNNTFNGGVTLAGGTLLLGSAAAFPAGNDLSLTGGTLDFNGNSPVIGNLNLGDGTTSLIGNLIDSAGDGSRRAGSLTLGGDINFNGATDVDGNDITAPVILNTDLTLSAGQHNIKGNGIFSTGYYGLTLDGVLSGAGGLSLVGSNVVALTNANTYLGPTVLSDNSTLYLGANNTLPIGTAVVLGDGAYLYLNPATTEGVVNAGNYDQSIGSLAGTGNVVLGGATLTVGNDNTDTTFSGSLNDHGMGGSLVKTGAGTLTLAGNNTFAGGVTLAGGTLLLGSAAAFPAGNDLSLTGGTLDLNGNSPVIGNLNLGDGNAALIGNLIDSTGDGSRRAGSLTLGGDIHFNGATDVDGNYITAPVILNTDLTLSAGQHNINGNGIFSTGFYDLTLSGALSGAGGMNLVGSNFVALTGTNSYLGPTVLSDNSTLYLGATHTLPIGTAVVLGDGAYLYLNPATTEGVVNAGNYDQSIGSLAGTGNVVLGGATLTVGNDNTSTTYSGSLLDFGAGGSLTKIGTGTLTLTGVNDYSGSTVLTGGVLNINSSDSLGTSTLNFAGGTLQFSANVDDTRTVVVSPTGGSVDTNGYDVIWEGPVGGTGTLTKVGAGTLTLNSDGSLSGNTLINGGSIVLGSSLALQNSVVAINIDNGLNVNGLSSATLGGLSGNGALNLGATALTIGNAATDAAYTGALAGTEAVTKIGANTQTLSTVGGYTGNFAVSAGTLALQGQVNATFSPVASGATLRLDAVTTDLNATQIKANSNATIQYANGTLIQGGFLAGPGTHLILPGGVIFEGGTALTGATLQQDNPLTLNSFVSGAVLISNAPLTWSGGTLAASGSLIVNSVANVSAVNSDGVITVAAGATLNNTDSSLALDAGSRTTIGSKTNPGGLLSLNGNTVELGGLLVNNGVVDGVVNINYGGLATGAGNYQGGYNINDGGALAPGNSPGALLSGSANWNAGGKVTFQIDDANGAAGINWSLNQINGTLAINAGKTPASLFTLAIQSLKADDAPGNAAGFDPTHNYSWNFVTTNQGIQGFDPSLFAIDSSGFSNPLDGGYFSVFQNGNNLDVNFVAASSVPEASSLVTAGLMLLGGTVALRRRDLTQR